MNKYYKAEEVTNLVNAVKGGYGMTKSTEELLVNLSTVGVSEDCISKHDIWKIIEDNAYCGCELKGVEE